LQTVISKKIWAVIFIFVDSMTQQNTLKITSTDFAHHSVFIDT